MQTLMLIRMKEAIGYGAIQFRVAETGNPLAPRLVGDGIPTDDFDFAQRGLNSLPKRYLDI